MLKTSWLRPRGRRDLYHQEELQCVNSSDFWVAVCIDVLLWLVPAGSRDGFRDGFRWPLWSQSQPYESLHAEARSLNSRPAPISCRHFLLSPLLLSPLSFWRCPFWASLRKRGSSGFFLPLKSCPCANPLLLSFYFQQKVDLVFFSYRPPPWLHLAYLLNDSWPSPQHYSLAFKVSPVASSPYTRTRSVLLHRCQSIPILLPLFSSFLCLQSLGVVDSTCVHFLASHLQLPADSVLAHKLWILHSLQYFFWSPVICYWPHQAFFPASLVIFLFSRLCHYRWSWTLGISFSHWVSWRTQPVLVPFCVCTLPVSFTSPFKHIQRCSLIFFTSLRGLTSCLLSWPVIMIIRHPNLYI